MVIIRVTIVTITHHMSLLDKLKKNSVIKESSSLEKSKFLEPDFTISTLVLAINIALSGEINGGMKPGLLQIAGPSRHFKTNMGLIIASAFLRSDKDAVIIFYDSEFGASKKYFESAGIDTSRVLHIPIMNIEELKFDMMKQLEGIDRKDKVMIFIDSIGNLASKKESDDAIDGKSVADMTRAKALKSLWRIVTPYLTMKQIPCIAINHIYMTQELYAKPVLGGGQGNMLSSNDVWIIGRSQEKGDDGVEGYTFTINIEKSRAVKEKSKIPVTVMFDGGIKRESGLLDLAIEFGAVIKPSNGWYSRVDLSTGEVEEKKYRLKECNYEWFKPIIDSKEFQQKVIERYQLGVGNLLDDGEFETTIEADDE